ncbi:MAG: transporter [Deltaproteobacteria bacterium]|nr:transporter [Deltaproteobacteria bacterium]
MFKFRMATVILAVMASVAVAMADGPYREIQDNSFLLEEAYNQEDGVIQHIQTFQYMKGDTWAYSFTQEWPVPTQAHQFSYTIPLEKLGRDEGRHSGLGDIALNYRYQLLFKEGVMACSPRFSLILPTGDDKKGLGNGAVGFQANLPLSLRLNERFVTHWNLGMTFTPNAKEPGGEKADTFSTNYGMSLVYLVNRNLNALVEFVGTAEQAVVSDGVTGNNNSFIINPGLRFAIDLKDLQIVPGISMPIGVGPSKGEYGVMAYLSFEHKLF